MEEQALPAMDRMATVLAQTEKGSILCPHALEVMSTNTENILADIDIRSGTGHRLEGDHAGARVESEACAGIQGD